MQRGRFNFEDFLRSLNMIRKMGPLKKVLGMLPGMGQMLKEVDLDDGHFKRVEAIILSMTPAERRNPEIIDMERRRRIAAGVRQPLQGVHDMLKQFKMMQSMMKKFGKGGGMPDMGDLEGLAGMPGMPGMPGMGGKGAKGGKQKLPPGFEGLGDGGDLPDFLRGGRRR